MKKAFIWLFLTVSSVPALACDHCNLYLNLSPNDYKNSIGFQYRSRLLMGSFAEDGTLRPKHAGHVVPNIAEKTLSEHYNRYELTGTFFIKKVWNVQAVLPMVNSVQAIDGLAKYSVWGIGDPIVIGNRQLFSTKNYSDSIRFSHRLVGGAGIKFPLGKTSITTPYGTPNLDLQPGSGSWDGLFLLTYIAKYKSLGFYINTNIKVNTQNVNRYQYGNTLNTSLYLFYQINSGNFTVIPSVGVYSEVAGYDIDTKIKAYDTGGQNYLGDIGLALFYKNIRLSANYQPKIASLMRSETQIDIKNRVIASLNFNF